MPTPGLLLGAAFRVNRGRCARFGSRRRRSASRDAQQEPIHRAHARQDDLHLLPGRRLLSNDSVSRARPRSASRR